jgi:LysM repeat protein
MVQRVPPHLGESTREAVSPWIAIAGVVLLILVTCGVLSILLDVPSRLGGLGLNAPTTPTRTPRPATPAVTTIPVTLPPASPTPGPTAATIKHKVKAGDNLTLIAAKYHVSIQAIMAANGLKDETIRIGEELIIPLPTPTPPGGAIAPQPPPAATPTAISFQSPPTSATPAGTPGVVRHTVVRGDTLITIAATYGSTVEAIRLANQLDSDLLSIGQVLQVPVGAWTPTALPTAVANITATPTTPFAYSAPNLLRPSEGQSFQGSQDTPWLQWTSPATLKQNESYVVHVEYISGGQRKPLPSLTVKEGTSIRLPSSYYPGPNPNGTQFLWYVVIVSQTSKAKADTPSPQVAQSLPSATWTFVWY